MTVRSLVSVTVHANSAPTESQPDQPLNLFEKTGTSRQADLVKIVVGFTNPLVT